MGDFHFSSCGNHAGVACRVIRNTFRDVGASDDIVRSVRHRGWYTDRAFCDATYRGNVWQLPARQGHMLFIAGYGESEGSGYVVLDAHRGKLRLFATAVEAALAGDELARIHAEQECDYQECWRAERDAEDTLTNSRETVTELLAAWREQRDIGALGTRLCADLRQRLTVAREAFREALCSLRRARLWPVMSDAWGTDRGGQTRWAAGLPFPRFYDILHFVLSPCPSAPSLSRHLPSASFSSHAPAR
ncbi:MAG: hypothetical protein EPN74_12615 [Rhodanobacter sp.]|nr:MAG: hypothetical protein EPN74_12615 [Rhodanobacter sp.]